MPLQFTCDADPQQPWKIKKPSSQYQRERRRAGNLSEPPSKWASLPDLSAVSPEEPEVTRNYQSLCAILSWPLRSRNEDRRKDTDLTEIHLKVRKQYYNKQRHQQALNRSDKLISRVAKLYYLKCFIWNKNYTDRNKKVLPINKKNSSQ